MEARIEVLHKLRTRAPRVRLQMTRTEAGRLSLAGVGSGLAGGIALGVPLVCYDWANGSHSALELPMAVTGWLFGLEHFAQNGYRWWPIVVGALFLALYAAVNGVAFAWLAERVYRIRALVGALAAGAAWSFVSFLLAWYVVLALARDGAPFRATLTSSLAVAPTWVWVVGFVAFGMTTALVHWALVARRAAAKPAGAE